jgi:hypothetical protein
LHRRAGFGQTRFFACLRFDGSQFGQVRYQQVLVGLGGFDAFPRRGELVFRRTPGYPGIRHSGHLSTGESIDHRTMPAWIDQAAIIVLTVKFDQRRGDFAQHRRAHRLIVYKRPASTIGFQGAPKDQRLARFDLDVGFG